jgi:hypothetical protein
MANTYTQIGATVTVGAGGAANISFAAIPNTFTDLVVKMSARSTSAGGVGTEGISLEINGSATGFSAIQLYGDGTTVGSSVKTTTYTGANLTTSQGTANTFNNTEFYFAEYAGSGNKVFFADNVLENNTVTCELDITANLWSNTAVISSLVFKTISGSNFAQHSTATLYGISKS